MGATAALLLWAGSSLAAIAQQRAPEPSPDRLVQLAERAEREPDFARAESLYRRALERGPGTRAARRAEVRLEWMAERRDDARGYAPLEALTRARRSDLDAAAAERFEARVERMPPGRVRREARLLLGETWLRRLGSPARAVPHYERLLEEPGLGPSDRALAQVALAEARAALGERPRAVEELERAGLGESFEARDMRAAERRETIRAWAIGLLALSVLLVVGAGTPWRAGRAGVRRALAPARLGAVLYVVAVPALVAELYQRGLGESFLWFGIAVLPVLTLGALAGESLRSHHAGRGRRLLTTCGVVAAPFAVAYLVLEGGGGLASFGL